MEFNIKLQELRKQKGMTQEELAGVLFVSRTAVSKWESGRGYPNIDSLKLISEFFGVSIDSLLSGEELLTAAKEDVSQKRNTVCDLLFGLLDISAVLLFILPLFRHNTGSTFNAVSLLSLTDVAPYIKLMFFLLTSATVLFGIITVSSQISENGLWLKCKRPISLLLTLTDVLFCIISLQPYAAVFLLMSLIFKVLFLIKK